MNKIKILLVLCSVLFAVQSFAAKTAPKALPSEIKKDFPCRCHEKGDHPKHHLLGKPFTKSEVSYSSVKDHEFYEVQLEDGKFALYRKGEVDKEGISEDTLVTIITPFNEISSVEETN